MFSKVSLRHAFAALVLCGLAGEVRADEPPLGTTMHPLRTDRMPPGQVGQIQLRRRKPMAGYFQPVQVVGPKGTLISLPSDGTFADAKNNRALAGMLIGQVYRLRVGNIDQFEGIEVFPSIEIIDRLCPPPGQETRFPIPIEITQEDLEAAIEGKYVLRVIYLEDSTNPLPVQDDPDHQRVLEASPKDDALRLAAQFGRPMAILRIGSRVPDRDAAGQFTFGSPPLLFLDEAKPVPRDAGLEPPAENVPPPRLDNRPEADKTTQRDSRPQVPPVTLRPQYPRLPLPERR